MNTIRPLAQGFDSGTTDFRRIKTSYMCRDVQFPFSVGQHLRSLLVVPSELNLIHPNICKHPRYVGAALYFLTCPGPLPDFCHWQFLWPKPFHLSHLAGTHSVQHSPTTVCSGKETLVFPIHRRDCEKPEHSLLSHFFDELSHWPDPFLAQRTLLVTCKNGRPYSGILLASHNSYDRIF